MLSHEDVIKRATETLKLFATHGIQYVHHVDVTDPSLTALKAMLEVQNRTPDWSTYRSWLFHRQHPVLQEWPS